MKDVIIICKSHVVTTIYVAASALIHTAKCKKFKEREKETKKKQYSDMQQTNHAAAT